MSAYQLDPVGASPAQASPVPTRLGPYELLGHLATGGMAEIYLARLPGFDEHNAKHVVVVKRLLPELVASQAFVRMFLEEGKLAGRLNHPNVCQLFHVGHEGAEYFLVMEYLDGVTVHDLISRPREANRLAELRVAGAIIVQACGGLHHAHESRGEDGLPAHLVHRDVSPSNLYVAAKGVVKVIDFGIAKVRGAHETEAGTIKGKTQYMSPEQLLGEPLDRRSDIFALGIVMFELATHQRLFKRESDYLTARAILEDPIPRADAVDPAIPAEVADVIAKALARDKNDRYADAAELGRAIEVVLAAHGGIASAATIAATVTATDALTAQRTRQARVLGDARNTGPLASGTNTHVTDLTPTKNRRVEAPTTIHVSPARQNVITHILILLIAIAIASAGAWITWRYVIDPHVANDLPPSPPIAKTPAAVQVPVPADALIEPIEMPAPPSRLAPVVKRPGMISIDSTPFATIFIDGKRVDVTPLLNHSLSPGRHQVRAVLGDGRTKDVMVDIPAGKAARPLALRW